VTSGATSKSATVWGDARSQEAPIVATAAASELERVLKAADQERMTLAIVDRNGGY